jgi:hypothetical protein
VNRIPFVSGLSALLFLAGCGTDRSTGGGGFGGETISGRVIDGSGKPVPGAALRARLSRSLDGQSLVETLADDSGRYLLTGLPVVSLRIEVSGRVGADSVNALVDRDPGRAAGDIVALSATSRRIRIVDGAGVPVAATLQAYGLGAVASTDDSGVVRLSGWPISDIWALVSPRDGSATFDLFVPATATGDLVAAPGWLVDDFEGTSTKTRLGLLIGGGWWYAVTAGTTADSVATNVTTDVFGHGYDTTQAHGGHASLHAKFVFSPVNSSRYGLVGFHLGVVDGASVDLSTMDSLVLWLKGNGPVRVDLVGKEQGVKRVYAKSVTPGTDWTRFALVPTDFAPVDGGTNWTSASTQALYLQFSVYSDTEFWLDDIRLFAKRLP